MVIWLVWSVDICIQGWKKMTIDDLLANTKGKTVAFDLDCTLTIPRHEMGIDFMNLTPNEFCKILYAAEPNKKAIATLNDFAVNNHIMIYTARSSYAKNITYQWLEENDVEFDEVIFRKATYDLFFDDKAYNADILNGEKE